ncbi:MAG: hypothetical protein J5825_12285 [Lachnospiraceae bacterium]|nr:hypothetical protein [Lachnospiraceae bacterium]
MRKAVIRNKAVLSLLSLALAGGLLFQAGCTPQPGTDPTGSGSKEQTEDNTKDKTEENSSEEVTKQNPSEENGSATEPGTEPSEPESETEPAEPEKIRIGSLKGPTSIGLAPLITGDYEGDPLNEYEFQIEATADVLLTAFMKEDLDVALIPANAAAVWYKKFQAEDKSSSEVTVIDINTLGVLYLVGPEDVNELIPLEQKASDLKDKKIFMTGQGTTPEYVFSYLMSGCGVNPASLNITWFSEASEVVAALAADTEAYAVLPQPYVTVATNKLQDLHMISSLNDCWNDQNETTGSRQVTGVTIVRTSFLEEHRENVDRFLADHEKSVEAASRDAKVTAGQVVEAGIIDNAAVAEKALPYCSLTCMTGSEMKEALSGYLKVLYQANPKSVGGSLPGDDFYYAGPEKDNKNESNADDKEGKSESKPGEKEDSSEESKEVSSEEETKESEGTSEVPKSDDGNYKASPENVKEIGRYQYWNGISWFSHAGCGIEFQVTGKTCKVTLAGDSLSTSTKHVDTESQARIEFFIDGEKTDDVLVDGRSKEVTVFDGTEEKTAVVRVIKVSEANLSSYGISNIYTDGTISPTEEKDLKIEFIGDSITCGYGLEANGKTLYSSTTESIVPTYAYLTAKELDADYSMVCASGSGIISGYAPDGNRNTANLMPEMYQKLGGSVSAIIMAQLPSAIRWNFSLYQPDVVVINLGTNDYSYTKEDPERIAEFESAYIDFVKYIRENNPDALIVCTLGLMGDNLYPNIEHAIGTYSAETGDTNITSMPFEVQNTEVDGVALDWHPSEKTHEKAAEKLASFLKENLKKNH